MTTDTPRTDAAKPKLTRESYDDTPRTDSCPQCGKEHNPWRSCPNRYSEILADLRAGYVAMTERAEKAEAEVERLKKMVIEAAELGDKRSENFKARAEKAEASLIKINEELCQAGLREYGN